MLDFLCGCIKLVNAMTLKLYYFTDFCRRLQSPAPIAVAKVARFFLKVNSYTYIHFKKVLVHGIRVFFLKTRLFLYADDVSVNGVTEFYVFGMKI